MIFQRRALPQSATLGERLRQIREESHWTVDDVSTRISVQAKYLNAIERGEYRQLPGPVYARNFVRIYSQALGVELATVMDMFDREYQIVTSGRIDRHLPSERVSTEYHWVRKHARWLIAGALVTMVVLYLGVQVERLLTPPSLIISTPAGDITSRDLRITVIGHTDVTASVTINSQPVDLDQQGNFREAIDLASGLNTLTITAAKKHSGSRVVVRRVLVEPQVSATSP